MGEKSLAHDILADLKGIASKLGYPPSRFEYLKETAFSEHKMKKAFGNFTAMMNAAGLGGKARKEREDLRKQEIKQMFDGDIKSQIKNRPPKIDVPNTRSILVIGDTHFPFVCQDTLAFIFYWCEIMKPQVCVQIGDLYDMFAHGRFPRTHVAYNPAEEIELGQQMAREMWRKIRQLSPGVECHQIRGNHDQRPLKRILSAYPEGEIFFSVDRYFEFDGVKSVHNDRQELIVDGITFIHGYSTRPGFHMEHNHGSTVVGHSHKGGVVYRGTKDGIIWELNAGYCGDPNSKALSYTPQKLTKWTKGFGFIDACGPRFIPAVSG